MGIVNWGSKQRVPVAPQNGDFVTTTFENTQILKISYSQMHHPIISKMSIFLIDWNLYNDSTEILQCYFRQLTLRGKWRIKSVDAFKTGWSSL